MARFRELFPLSIAEAKAEIDEAEEAAEQARERLRRLEAEQRAYEAAAKLARQATDTGLLTVKKFLAKDTSGLPKRTGWYLAYVDEIADRGLSSGT